jgi:hypothetical protein
MDLNALKAVAVAKSARTVLQAKKFSPQILTGLGLVGGVATVVMASKATLQLEEKLDKIKDSVWTAKQNASLIDAEGDHVYTEADHVKDVAYAYARGTLDLVKLYGPAASVGVVSVVCIISAQGIMQKRNAALVGAYAALEKGFNEYRKRVEGALGEDKEKELRYGIEREEITNGKGEKEVVVHIDKNQPSPYARFFDETSSAWERNAETNLYFLRCQQTYANDKLTANGHLFLNEVYDMLGIDRSQAGAVVGWVLGPDNDNFVDFGIYNGDEKAREFVNGRERSILLDFNVDGIIFDKI